MFDAENHRRATPDLTVRARSSRDTRVGRQWAYAAREPFDPISRREFLRRAAASSAALAAAGVLPGRSSAADPSAPSSKSPNEKLNIGVIGVANRGAANLEGVASENIVALCDVDAANLAGAAKQFPRAEKYSDYRKLLERTDLDAVVVSTPDHTHAIPVVGALRLGLDVYCEKPLAHSVYEVREIRQAAAEQNVVTQMGTQIHAGDNYRRAVEIVRSGMLGDITRVHVWQSNSVRPGRRVAEASPPKGVDYDLWIGPAPMRPFDLSHFHFNWRYWWDFGGGILADMGCHYIDLPFWSLGLRYPTSIVAHGEKTYEGDNHVPDNLRVDYQFPERGDQPPVHLTWYHGTWKPEGAEEFGKGSAVLFEGTKGRLLADYGSRQLFMNEGEPADPPAESIPNSIGHHQEWIAACKSRGPTTCNFDYSGALAEAVLLGNVAYRTGEEPLQWDAESLTVTNNSGAAQFIRREYRQGWRL